MPCGPLVAGPGSGRKSASPGDNFGKLRVPAPLSRHSAEFNNRLAVTVSLLAQDFARVPALCVVFIIADV